MHVRLNVCPVVLEKRASFSLGNIRRVIGARAARLEIVSRYVFCLAIDGALLTCLDSYE